METETVLREIGLDKREAKIYLSLLRLNSSTASKLAREVGIDRSTTYDVLAKLIEKGIVSHVIKNNVKHFNPTSPERLWEDLQEKQKRFREIMPNLMELSRREPRETEVELFKGKEGIITVFRMILRDKKDYLFLGGGQDSCKIIPLFMKQFLNKAHALGMKGRVICEEGFGNSRNDVIGKNETYRITSRKFTSTTTKVWGNKTAFFIFTEPYYAILICSKEVAERQRLFFDYVWSMAKKPSAKQREKTLLR